MFHCPSCHTGWPSEWAAAECEVCLPYACPMCTTRYPGESAAASCCRD